MRRSLSIILLLVGVWTVQAQDVAIPAPKAAFVAYQCTFQTETNSVQVRAVLMGANGQPIPPENYSLSVTPVGAQAALPSEQVRTEIVPQRPPLQLILVLDITDTVPVEQVVNAISGHLAPQLNVEDQVALITFSREISPMTPFYTDKNRLINEHMIDLITLDGDNQLYDAISEAVESFPFNSSSRKAVLVLTDSGRRQTPQTPSDAIILKAKTEKVEIYPIGFYSRDTPDLVELANLGGGTGGFSWLYTERRNSRASIEAAVSGYLDDFVRTLNSEILVTVDVSGLTPDGNGRIPLGLTVDSSNDAVMTDQVSCPVEILSHSITFLGGVNDAPVTGRADIGVAVESDLAPEQLRIVFRANDEIVQNSTNTIYTFDAAQVDPGYYTLRAELWDQANNTLAATPTTVRLYAQQRLQLSVADDAASVFTDSARFVLASNPEFGLGDAEFTIASVTDAAQTYPLGSAAFGGDGRATLNVDDFYSVVKGLFPNVTAQDQFQVSATVPGVNADDPARAVSNPLTVSVVPPVEAASAPTVGVISVPGVSLDFRLVGPGAVLALLILNLILFRIVGRRRILRLINTPDDFDLSPQLMAITVRRGDIKQPHTLTKKTITIGRGSSNDINLGDDPGISRQHGVVMWRRKAWYYTNRKSQTLTRIDGKRYRGLIFFHLEPVTELEIGQNLLIFHSNAQQDISDFIKTNL